MIRRILCLLGFHKWVFNKIPECSAPDMYICDCLCSFCKHAHHQSCEYCGKTKK